MNKVPFRAPAAVWMEDPADPEILAALKADLPRSAQRRMTLLGKMAHRVLEGRDLAAVPAIVYLTAYAESQTLEQYLASFPTPSPMGFQASIHPSAVEQSLILRRQSMPYFLPLAGLDALFQALRAAASLAPGSLLLAGEERGTWLPDYDLSSTHNFCWGVEIVAAAEAEGWFEWEAAAGEEAEGAYPDLARALAQRVPWTLQRPEAGRLRLSWK